MKLIFLDVDGVLNSEEYIVKEHDRLGHEIYVKTYLQQGGIPFDPKCLKFLKYIIDKTNALICVSSTWRLSKDKRERLNLILGSYADRIIGYIPYFGFEKARGFEIEQFLNNLKEIKCPLENYIIIDDDNDMKEEQMEHLILTNYKTGLTIEDAIKSVEKLNKKEK